MRLPKSSNKNISGSYMCTTGYGGEKSIYLRMINTTSNKVGFIQAGGGWFRGENE
jgi:hypothetical protein